MQSPVLQAILVGHPDCSLNLLQAGWQLHAYYGAGHSCTACLHG